MRTKVLKYQLSKPASVFKFIEISMPTKAFLEFLRLTSGQKQVDRKMLESFKSRTISYLTNFTANPRDTRHQIG